MFDQVDTALEALLRSDQPQLENATISFGEYTEEDTKPALWLDLWRVNVSAKGAVSGSEVIERDDGVKIRRPYAPIIELSYAVSARGDDTALQHSMLAAALRAFLRNTTVPDDQVPAALVTAGATVSLRVPKRDPDAGPGPDHSVASIDLRVSVPMELDRGEVLAEAPGSTDFGFEDQNTGATSGRQRFAGEVADPAAVGADVIGPGGVATVEADGRFAIVARPGDELTIMVDPPVTVVVPESGKIVVP